MGFYTYCYFAVVSISLGYSQAVRSVTVMVTVTDVTPCYSIFSISKYRYKYLLYIVPGIKKAGAANY